MAADEHLKRIDRHMARADGLLDEVRAEVQLTREVIRRNEIAFQQSSRLNAELVHELREFGAETKKELRELAAETRARTEAIFRMLDRFDGGEPAGA